MADSSDKKMILIGHRCTGKTSIGKRLAERLGIPFIDIDALVEKSAGQSIRMMIEESGWTFFREMEKKVITILTTFDKSVIATGGGAVMDEENAAILKKEGWLIWLSADEETIMHRMLTDAATADQRPPLSNLDLKKEITDTLAVRTPIYRRLADFSIDTGMLGIEESVQKIMHYFAEHQGV